MNETNIHDIKYRLKREFSYFSIFKREVTYFEFLELVKPSDRFMYERVDPSLLTEELKVKYPCQGHAKETEKDEEEIDLRPVKETDIIINKKHERKRRGINL